MKNFGTEVFLNDIDDLVQENLQANYNPKNNINEIFNDFSKFINYFFDFHRK